MASAEGNVPTDAPPRLRIFCDADVLIAGAASTTGASHVLLQLSELTLIECLTSGLAVSEVERNLLAKIPEALPAFQLILQAAVEVVRRPSPAILGQLRRQAHEKDVAILAAAVSSRSDFLATFNVRHFRPRNAAPLIMQPGRILSRIRVALSRLSSDV